MNINSETKSLEVLNLHGIEVLKDSVILYARGKEFEDEVHDALDILIDEFNYDIKFI